MDLISPSRRGTSASGIAASAGGRSQRLFVQSPPSSNIFLTSGPPSGQLAVHRLRRPPWKGDRTVPPRLITSGPPSGQLAVHRLRRPPWRGDRTVPPRYRNS